MTELTRRRALQLMGAAGGSGLLMHGAGPLAAQQGRALQANILGFTLGIHVPAIVALNEGMEELGYSASDMVRLESMQAVTQGIVAGSSEVGEGDVVSALTASEAGADIRLTGLVYNNTSQVLVVNRDIIQSFEDFKKPEATIAINSRGDFIYIMLSGVFDQNGIDIEQDTTLVEVGGSGSRMRALLAGRVAAVPVHFDQAVKIAQEGNFEVMVEPGKIFDPWLSEAWLVNGSWLENDENRRILTDLQKATITSFRRANADLGYYADGYRKYATVKGAQDAKDEDLEWAWSQLSTEIKAWPNDGGFKKGYFERLIPVYERANALRGTLDLGKAVDTSFVDAALQELDS